MNFLATPIRRRVLFGALYLSEGAPIGYVWWALPTRLADAGVAIDRITALTAVLVLPWALKFLWAPLVDTLRTPRWGYRSWIVAAQISMGLALIPLLALDLRRDFPPVYALLVVHAFSAATQDVAVDALSIATVPIRERGSINGWMQAGMLLGRSLFGGVGLIVGRTAGQTPVILALIAVTWGSLILVVLSRPGVEGGPTGRRGRDFLAALRAAATHRNLWLGLAFAALGGAAFEGVGSVAGPFLRSRGSAVESVGWLFAVPAPAGMALGALIGGAISDRIGRKRAVAFFLGLIAADVLLLAHLAAAATAPGPGLYGALAGLYVGIGLFTAASYALFMDLTDVRLGATQFSAYMGATNACESWSAFAIGQAAAAFGYSPAFVLMSGLSLLSLPVLLTLRPGETRRPTPPAGSAG